MNVLKSKNKKPSGILLST